MSHTPISQSKHEEKQVFLIWELNIPDIRESIHYSREFFSQIRESYRRSNYSCIEEDFLLYLMIIFFRFEENFLWITFQCLVDHLVTLFNVYKRIHDAKICVPDMVQKTV